MAEPHGTPNWLFPGGSWGFGARESGSSAIHLVKTLAAHPIGRGIQRSLTAWHLHWPCFDPFRGSSLEVQETKLNRCLSILATSNASCAPECTLSFMASHDAAPCLPPALTFLAERLCEAPKHRSPRRRVSVVGWRRPPLAALTQGQRTHG